MVDSPPTPANTAPSAQQCASSAREKVVLVACRSSDHVPDAGTASGTAESTKGVVREHPETWKLQKGFLRLRKGRHEHTVWFYCDTGSRESCMVDTAIERLELDEAFHRHITYGSSNLRYLKWLHKRCPKSKKQNGIHSSKYKYLHKVFVKIFGFEESTHTEVHFAKQLTGRPARSIGRVEVEVVLLESLPDTMSKEEAYDIPDKLWEKWSLPVVSMDPEDPGDYTTNFDVLAGTNRDILNEDWFRKGVRMRSTLPDSN